MRPETPTGGLTLRVDAPEADDEQREALREKTERYCTALQTLTDPPRLDSALERA